MLIYVIPYCIIVYMVQILETRQDIFPDEKFNIKRQSNFSQYSSYFTFFIHVIYIFIICDVDQSKQIISNETKPIKSISAKKMAEQQIKKKVYFN